MRQEIQSFFAAYLFLYHFVYILKNPVHVQGFISWLVYAEENPAEYRNSLLALAANFIIVCVEIHHI